ncbi:coxsackievirus and adenovirus receptor homolog isoform X2 [Girardinichthys multiradiatus]|uniref:coxsackievirus and adenovirus receptor homolog isoform X2 n=2 Tax=Girardinichthys multiradiatus TaxID=208333 RepID=UPI001FAD2A97|nr:coxsackievirus and adenovirus receptor homolog isoform X2 [Girardinichthys multiradiatus]
MEETASLRLLFGMLLLCGATFQESHEEIHVEAGNDVILSCQYLQSAEITALKWYRSDTQDYVFFYQEKRQYERYQNPLFQGRVQLMDPQMRNGNLSIVLSNTSLNDAGTYCCDVGVARRKRADPTETIQVILLKVTLPAAPTDEPTEVGGNNLGLTVGLPIGAVLLVLAVVAVVIVIIRKIHPSITCQHDSL